MYVLRRNDRTAPHILGRFIVYFDFHQCEQCVKIDCRLGAKRSILIVFHETGSAIE